MSSVIVEIRAGTGGEEAALFAKDLFRMYSKYARSQNWKETIFDLKESDLGGIKQVVFELANGDVFSKMKYEAGVHRVQRIPKTEKSGRIHTSTATVAILRKPEKAEININPNDLKIDYFKASGPGGQYVNKRMTAVRITHLPTGLVVTCQTERSLQQNKESALEFLKAKILEMEELKNLEKLSKERREQIGWAKRAEKIRTYNFPQNRVTDHRIKKSWHDLDKILDGDLEPVIRKLQQSFG
jgi:peptide chain release factor 1